MDANQWKTACSSLTDCVEVQWKKSSLSVDDGNCVEVGVWKTSSQSGPWSDACVEVAGAEDGDVLVRDTKDHGNGPVLTFTPKEWDCFVQGVKLNEFDLPPGVVA